MLADRVLHTTTTVGTGSYDLADPSSALYLSAVSSVGSGNRLTYAVEFGTSWELCWGVVTAGSPATLTRNLIRSSTGALINWGAGTKTIYSVSQADLLRFGGRGSLPISAGTANAQTLAHITPLRSLQAGMEVVFVPGTTNTGATTLAVDALGAIAALAPSGAACTGGELRASVPARAVYNGTSWRLVSYSPSATGTVLLNVADAAAARTAIGATTTGSAVLTAADAPAARFSLSVAAAPTGVGGIAGQWVELGAVNGANLVLPSGGTWAAFASNYDASTNIFSGVTVAAVAAGGSVILAGLSGFYNKGFAWRIA